MPSLTEVEVMGFLKAVENGSVTLRPDYSAQDVYAGNVPYTASNGWHITIFNDVNEWDYIDKIQTPDGNTVDFDVLEQMPLVNDYSPSDEIAWTRYRIPGYCQFRCESCGTLLPSEQSRLPFLCPSCQGKPSTAKT
jgi:hypothetical protein